MEMTLIYATKIRSLIIPSKRAKSLGLPIRFEKAREIK